MKIVELLIDDEEDLAGGNAIAMVHNPAHETDFVQFNKDQEEHTHNFFQAFADKEHQIVPTEEQQEKLFQQFSATGVDLQTLLIDGYIVHDVEPVGDISMKYLNEKFSATDINARPIDDVLNDKSIMDYSDGTGEYKVRFRYATRPGRPSILSTSRTFCKEMIKANKTYRLEDINKIANGFQKEYPGVGNWGDAFFKFGGPNCGHIFVKVTYQKAFNKDKSPKFRTIDEQTAGDAAIQAGSNMNTATQDNPSPQTIKRAGLGQFSSQEIQKFNDDLAKSYCLAGPILIPEKLIYRRDPKTNEEYYVFFSKESVKKIAYKYARDSFNNNTNIEHNPNQPINNITLAESWIITNPDDDKSNQYGFNLIEGTWFGIIDCSKNMDFWNKYVASNKVLGFSLEGYFESQVVQFHNNKNKHSKNNIDTYILEEIVNILNK